LTGCVEVFVVQGTVRLPLEGICRCLRVSDSDTIDTALSLVIEQRASVDSNALALLVEQSKHREKVPQSFGVFSLRLILIRTQDLVF
jgi:hypothetical protein